MISFILVLLAAACNAVMDILENENFSSSVFKNLNPKWWYKRESWKYAKKIFGWKYDGWHVFKSTMIVLLVGATVLYSSVFDPWIDFFVMGAIWNGTFSFTYKQLKKAG